MNRLILDFFLIRAWVKCFCTKYEEALHDIDMVRAYNMPLGNLVNEVHELILSKKQKLEIAEAYLFFKNEKPIAKEIEELQEGAKKFSEADKVGGEFDKWYLSLFNSNPDNGSAPSS